MLRVHCFQHVPFEGLGSIQRWLHKSGYVISYTRFFESPRLPRMDDFDLLIIMGGPMSVNDEVSFPWLQDEKRFIQSAIDAGKRILGVCLGAQLIASALGASVYPNREKEIGWFPVQAVNRSTDQSLFHFPESVHVFHWHGETFDLPKGSIRLARSEACENQAFQFGSSVIGLQFHIEMMPESVREIVFHCKDELHSMRYVQSDVEILSADHKRYEATNALMDNLLNYLEKSRS